jgi:hypothetical protein
MRAARIENGLVADLWEVGQTFERLRTTPVRQAHSDMI